MNVGDSVRFSLDHWQKGEWDAAMLHACNAVDGTAKERYPDLGVAARYKKLIRESLDIYGVMAAPGVDLEKTRFPVQVKSDSPDGRPDIADVLYHVHRCAHGHEDESPVGFELTPNSDRADGSRPQLRMESGKIQLSATAVIGLLAVAVFAPENKGQKIPDSYRLSWGQHVFFIRAWWGWQDHFREIISVERAPTVIPDYGHWWDGWTPVQ